MMPASHCTSSSLLDSCMQFRFRSLLKREIVSFADSQYYRPMIMFINICVLQMNTEGGGSAVQLLNFPTKYLYSRPKIKVRWTGVDISLNNKGSELTPS